MKIGIITLPLHINYGGILQNFALQKVLNRMGHEVYTIEKEKKLLLPLKKRYLAYTKRILKRYILRKQCEIFFEKEEQKRNHIISKKIRTFVEQNIQIKKYDHFNSIKENEYDAIIVGSDQIWRPKYFKDIKNAFLAFAQKWNIIRIAYAASFGTDVWEYNKIKTKQCKKLISLFNAVSVRESQGVMFCKKYFNTEALHVLDPTFLISKEEYIKIFTDSNTPKSEGNLLVYFLDESVEKDNIAKHIANKKQLKLFLANRSLNKKINPINRIQPSVEEWLRGFYDADFVITDSFHACVFSIIFQKPFLVYGNQERGLSRITSLLSLFHLNDRMIKNINDLDHALNHEIDWNKINNILKEKKEESFNFLQTHLEIKNQTH